MSLPVSRGMTGTAAWLALLRMSGSFITGGHGRWGLEFSTGNSAVARRVLVYLKKDFGLMPSTMVRQGRRLRKKNVYTLVVQPSAEGLAFLNTMGLSPGGRRGYGKPEDG